MHKPVSGKCQRGVAAIEMAITLPVLLMLLIATAELGRAFYQYNTLTKSVRDGVRYLADNAIDGTTGLIDLNDATRAAVQNLVVYANTGGTGQPLLSGLNTGDVSVSAVDVTHVAVTVNFAYQPIFARIPTFGAGPDIGTAFSLNASATMRALQ